MDYLEIEHSRIIYSGDRTLQGQKIGSHVTGMKLSIGSYGDRTVPFETYCKNDGDRTKCD